MAAALAAAGADIIGVSASLEPSGSEVEKDVRGAGPHLRGASAPTSPTAPRYRARGADLAGRDAGRHPGQQRRHDPPRPGRRTPDDDWDLVLPGQPDRQFVADPRGRPAMVDRGHGKIIFTASLLSFQGGINVPGYAAAKSGIAGLTKALANEWAPQGVNVNAIAPGYIATDNTQALQDDPERSTAILDRIPAGRWGDARRPRRAPPCSSPPTPPTTSTASSCPSTAGGSADDDRR